MWTQSCYTKKNSFSSVWAEDTASFHVQIKLSLITEPSMRFRAEKKKKKKNNRVRPCWSFSVLFSRQKYAASWEQMNRRCVSLQHTCNMYTFVFLFVLYVFILAFFFLCVHAFLECVRDLAYAHRIMPSSELSHNCCQSNPPNTQTNTKAPLALASEDPKHPNTAEHTHRSGRGATPQPWVRQKPWHCEWEVPV